MSNAFQWDNGQPSVMREVAKPTKSGKTRTQVSAEIIERRKERGENPSYISGIGKSEPIPSTRRAPGHYRG